MCVCAYAEEFLNLNQWKRKRNREREREDVYVCVSKNKIILKLMKKYDFFCTVRIF